MALIYQVLDCFLMRIMNVELINEILPSGFSLPSWRVAWRPHLQLSSPGLACLPPASVSILFPPSLLSEHTPAYHPPSPLWSKNRVNTHTQRSAKKHESTHTHTYTALYHSQFGPGLKTSNGGGYDRKTTGGTLSQTGQNSNTHTAGKKYIHPNKAK